MILTVTPNPSVDSTLSLKHSLMRGTVHRVGQAYVDAGGKGINVASTIAKARYPVLALYPAPADDVFNTLVAKAQIPARRVNAFPHDAAVRINVTIAEADGITTKLNQRGPHYDARMAEELIAATIDSAQQASWVVLAGSLPPGLPVTFYATLTEALHEALPGIKVAVDTSDAPLRALAERFSTARPDLIKPNGEELGQLVGQEGDELESGDLMVVADAARALLNHGVGTALVTLGDRGAILATSSGVWAASPPPTNVLSTVGAGDSSLAGYLLACTKRMPEGDRLRTAVAYGSAAAGLAGTSLPSPDHIDFTHTTAKKMK